jgi:filamin
VKKYAKGQVVPKSILPVFKSDASKVACKGMGLKKAYLNKQNTFSVQGAEAGNMPAGFFDVIEIVNAS